MRLTLLLTPLLLQMMFCPLPVSAKNNATARLDQAFELSRVDKEEAALKMARSVAPKDCNTNDLLLRCEIIAESSYQLQKFSESIVAFDELIALRRKLLKSGTLSASSRKTETHRLVLAYVHKAKALSRLHRFNDSMECLNEALRIEPEDPSALRDRAKVFVRMGRAKEGLSDVNKVLEGLRSDLKTARTPASAYSTRAAIIESLYLRAEAYRKLGKLVDSKKDQSYADKLTSEL